jgi:hypothetical protein
MPPFSYETLIKRRHKYFIREYNKNTIIMKVFCFLVLCVFAACSGHLDTQDEQNDSQKVYFKTGDNIQFSGKINGNNAVMSLDNCCFRTMVDSSFFVNYLDTLKYNLKSISKYTNYYNYEGELTIEINEHVFVVNNFCVINFQKHISDSLNVVIGYDILEQQKLKIDFINKNFEFIRDSSGEDTFDYDTIFLTDVYMKYKYRKYFEANVFVANKKKKGKFLLDFGCYGKGYGIFKQKFISQMRNNMLKLDDLGNAKSTHSMNTSKSTIWQIDSIKICNTTIFNVPIATLSLGLSETDVYQDDPLSMEDGDGLLGWGIFKDYTTILDLKNNLLLVKKESKNE